MLTLFLDDVFYRLIQLGINALLGKGIIHHHAVPILLLVLGEGALQAGGVMRIADIFGVIRRGAEQDGHVALVLINIGKANSLTIGRKGKVVITHQKLAVGRTVGAIIAFHLLAEGCRQMFDDALFAYQACGTRLLCRRDALLQGHFLFGLFLGSGDLCTYDVINRLIQLGINALLGKGIIHHHAVPILLLVLGEGAL